jgi:hypothetical protein
MTTYPPEPWDLHGHAYIGVWLLPRNRTPAPHAPGTTVVRVLGRSIVCAAFFRYERPSPLTYDEVMATVLVRQGWRLRVSITHIWVDSPASRDGGRDLWAIPKELAAFETVPQVSYAAQGIGSLVVQRERRLPWRWPVGFRIAQGRAGSALITPVRGRIRHGLVSARWSFASDGSLGFLAGRRPVLTLAARPFHLVFGRR